MRSKNNEWIRAEKNAVLKIWCRKETRPRLIAIVTVWPGRGYLLHQPSGFGNAVDPRHAAISVPCRCVDGHRINQATLLDVLESGRRHAHVVGRDDLLPLE